MVPQLKRGPIHYYFKNTWLHLVLCVMAFRVRQGGEHIYILKYLRHPAGLQMQRGSPDLKGPWTRLRPVSSNSGWRQRSVVNISKGCCAEIPTFTQFRALCRILSWIINDHLCTIFLHRVTPELTKAASIENFQKIPTRQSSVLACVCFPGYPCMIGEHGWCQAVETRRGANQSGCKQLLTTKVWAFNKVIQASTHQRSWPVKKRKRLQLFIYLHWESALVLPDSAPSAFPE